MKSKYDSQSLCEDGLFIGQKMIAVVDGVTAQANRKYNGKSSGCFAKDVLLETLNNKEDTLSDMDTEELYLFLNNALGEAVREAMMGNVIVDETKNPLGVTTGDIMGDAREDALDNEMKDALSIDEYPRACLIIYNDVKHELSAYGDCQAIVGGEQFDFSKEIDRINSEYRSLVLAYAVANGATIDELLKNDIGRKAIEDSLKNRFVFENIPGEYGYPTLNGYNLCEEMIFKKEINENTELVLASDGYPILKETLAKSEVELERLMKEDPLCFRLYKCTKGLTAKTTSFDDRTYWRGIA